MIRENDVRRLHGMLCVRFPVGYVGPGGQRREGERGATHERQRAGNKAKVGARTETGTAYTGRKDVRHPTAGGERQRYDMPVDHIRGYAMISVDRHAACRQLDMEPDQWRNDT